MDRDTLPCWPAGQSADAVPPSSSLSPCAAKAQTRSCWLVERLALAMQRIEVEFLCGSIPTAKMAAACHQQVMPPHQNPLQAIPVPTPHPDTRASPRLTCWLRSSMALSRCTTAAGALHCTTAAARARPPQPHPQAPSTTPPAALLHWPPMLHPSCPPRLHRPSVPSG